jgi:hypothetical protein
MSYVMAAGALVGTVGSLVGGNQQRKGAKAQRAAAERAAAMYDKINIPDIEKQKLILDRYNYQGDYDPEKLLALGLDPSQMQNVNADQQALDAQVEALNQVREIAQGGMTESDEAAARQLSRKVASDDIARRKAVLNQMAQRGTLGSGMELAAQLQQAQDSTQSQSDANDRLIQQALARSLDGSSRLGNLAEQMRYQDFSEKSQKARAADEINKFNITNSQSITNQNVGNRNIAQLRNLDAQQLLNNSNVDLANRQQQFNKGLLQNQFDNQMRLTDAKAGRQQAIGNAQANVSNQNANMIGGIAGGIANLGGAIGQNIQNQENSKNINRALMRNRAQIIGEE